MLLNKFKKIYSTRPIGPTKNRIGLTRKDEGDRKVSGKRVEMIISSSPRLPQIRIYPSENCGGIGVN
jgi:hypothetical protein